MGGKAVAGFAAAKDHLSYLPHSGSVLGELADDLAGYHASKGSLRFAVDNPLPDDLVEKLIAARLAELARRSPRPCVGQWGGDHPGTSGAH